MKTTNAKKSDSSLTMLGKFISAVRAKLNGKDGVWTPSIMQYCALLDDEFLLSKKDYKGIKSGFKSKLESREKKAFVFGAGISMGEPFKLPSWTSLLKNAVMSEFVENYEDVILKSALVSDTKAESSFFNSFDLYELGQFIEELRRNANSHDELSKDEIERRTDLEMYNIVKNALIAACGGKFVVGENNLYRLRNETQLKNTFINYLCELANNCRINRIVTYNYDNAFEYAFSNMHSAGLIKPDVTPIFIDDQLDGIFEDVSTLPIYHVHGFTPIFDEPYSQTSNIKECGNTCEGKKLILSEASYDDMAHSSYKWRNVVQIDTFLRYSCIFFGFSATDINFKRIVKLMDWHTEDANYYYGDNKEHAVQHYIFMTIDAFINGIFGIKFGDANNSWQTIIKNMSLGDLDTKLKYLYFTLQMKRKYLRGMHIYPIWCTKADIDLYVKNLLKD